MPRLLKWALGIGTALALAIAALLVMQQNASHNFETSFNTLFAILILFCWGLIAGSILLLWVLVRVVGRLAWLLGARMALPDPGDLDDPGDFEGAEESDHWEDMRYLDDLPG